MKIKSIIEDIKITELSLTVTELESAAKTIPESVNINKIITQDADNKL